MTETNGSDSFSFAAYTANANAHSWHAWKKKRKNVEDWLKSFVWPLATMLVTP